MDNLEKLKMYGGAGKKLSSL